MHLLGHQIRPYPWGSVTAIPQLMGVEPDGRPQAEMWMGAHPDSPSVLLGSNGDEALDLAVQRDPNGMLGSALRDRFGVRLPFLLKVLAAEAPLSLQVHPSEEQARAGHAREEKAGVPVDAPDRTYRDPHHKPEMILALTSFDALCGFRAPVETLRVMDALDAPGLSEVRAALRHPVVAEGLSTAFTAALTSAGASRLVDAVVGACRRRLERGSPFPREDSTVVMLGESYPGDPGVVVSLLLNRVTLQPGEALFLAAGNVHSYLRGVGIEIMASSDNVLRGGLTTKHVDVPELLRTVDFAPIPVPYVSPRTAGSTTRWRTAAEEFELARVSISGDCVVVPGAGPRIVLCTDGAVQLETATTPAMALARGRSAFVAAADGELSMSGSGEAYVALTRQAS